MQLDPGGILASLLSGLLPEAAPSASGDEKLPAEAFQQILSRLGAVVAACGGGQPSLDFRPAFQPLPVQSRPPEAGAGQAAFSPDVPAAAHALFPEVPALEQVDDLQALVAQMKVLAQRRPDRLKAESDDIRLLESLAAAVLTLQDFPPAEAGTARTGMAISRPSAGETVDSTSGRPVIPSPDAVPSPGGDPAAPAPGTVAFPESDTAGMTPDAVTSPENVTVPAVPSPGAAGPDTSQDGDLDGFKPAVSVTGQEPAAPEVAKRESPVSEEPAGAEPVPSRQEPVPSRLEAPKDFQSAPDAPPVRSAAPLTVTRPLDHPGWSDELGERLLWLRDNSVQGAELRIHPEHLGPVAVRIQVHEDRASIQFASQHAVVREALEAALPRLRELFAGQQLQLTQVEVGHQFPGDQAGAHPGHSDGRRSDQRPFRSDVPGEAGESTERESPRRLPAAGDRLLNLYA